MKMCIRDRCRALVFITACPEPGLLFAVALLIVYMLAHQVEDGEVVLLLKVLQTVDVYKRQQKMQPKKLVIGEWKVIRIFSP